MTYDYHDRNLPKKEKKTLTDDINEKEEKLRLIKWTIRYIIMLEIYILLTNCSPNTKYNIYISHMYFQSQHKDEICFI